MNIFCVILKKNESSITTLNIHISTLLNSNVIFANYSQITYDGIYMKHFLCFVRFSFFLLWLIENGKINACDYDDNKSHADWVNKLMRNNLDWDKQPQKIRWWNVYMAFNKLCTFLHYVVSNLSILVFTLVGCLIRDLTTIEISLESFQWRKNIQLKMTKQRRYFCNMI